ncbi:hypothetical protein F5B19DRAFT_395825 [Rostrohypoxylon terebratum]|nr:hypothetical protein F5B19DRAFT_395825 [Rostrohypoxylon terebratum]
MPISSTTQRISSTEWASRKPRILELYLSDGCKLANVMRQMKEEGFTATKSQYEHQFKIWGVRKNMKRSEWEKAIEERQQGEMAPIILTGRAISNSRIETARRRYAPRRPRTLELSDTVLPGNQYTTQDNLAMPIEELAPGAIMTDIQPHNGTCDLNFDQEISLLEFASEDGGFLHENRDVLDATDLVNFDAPAIGDGTVHSDFYIEPFTLNFPSDQSMDTNQPSTTSISWNSWPNLLDIASVGLNDTTDRQGQMISMYQWTKPLPSSQFTSIVIKGFRNRSLPIPDQSALWQLFVDINNSTQKLIDIQPSVKFLFSSRVLVGERQNQLATPPNDLGPEARLYARFIAIAINGFAGLKTIPAPCVLRFLNGNFNVQESMVKFLSSTSGPVARSLAENMFRAAIEADDVDVAKYLLDQTDLIDANNTVLCYSVFKDTPLIRAARCRSFKIMELLINRRVDVNNTISSEPRGGTALQILLDSHEYYTRPVLDDVFLRVFDALLEAKATISEDCILYTLRFTDMRLAIRIIKESPLQPFLEFLYQTHLSSRIIEQFNKQDAASIVRIIVGKCCEPGGDLLVRGSRYFQELLEESVRHGYDEVAEILLPYSLFPGEIFKIALKTNNRAMTELILQMYPDKEMECIKPPITALELRGRTHLRCSDGSGLFNSLQGNLTPNAALVAALEAGNSEYVTNLDMDLDLEFVEDDTRFDCVACFGAALAHNLDEIAWDLLSLGKEFDSYTKLLNVAIRQRKLEFVKAIIESGLLYDCEMGSDSFWRRRRVPFNGDDDHDINDISEASSKGGWLSILEAAIECGDDSISTYILRTNQTIIYKISPSIRLLDLALKNGRPSLLSNIVESGDMSDVEWKNDAAELAITRESILLLDILIGLGARLDHDSLLRRAVATHPVMIGPLLERWRNICPEGHPRYGLDAILKAIKEYKESPGLLDTLFASKLITVDTLRERREDKNPLCYAIMKECPISLIKRLLDVGGDINYAVWYGVSKTTAFLDSIGSGNMELVELFIRYGADLNRPASFGIRRTPLQKAVEVDNLEIVHLLLNKGVDVNAPPAAFFGATALQLAAIQGNCEIVKLLVEHGVNFNVPPSRGRGGRWPLEGAAEHGRLDMIMLLWGLNGGAFDTKQCQRAMRFAERNGHLGCRDLIKELMDGGSSDGGLDWP